MGNRRTLLHQAGVFSYSLLVLGFLTGSVCRSFGIWRMVSRFTGSSEPLYWSVLHQDAIVVGSGLLLLYLGFFNPLFKRLRPFAYLSRIGVVCLVLAYTADVWLILSFFKRLYYRDVLTYGLELQNGLTLMAAFISDRLDWISPATFIFLIVVFLLALVFAFLCLQFGPQRFTLHARILLALGGGLVLVGLMPIARIDRPGAVYRNLFSYNMPRGGERPYSEAFIRSLAQKPPPAPRRVPGPAARPDIIVLIVESLSALHSRYFSGIHDYMPQLDRIARENISLVNFYANGPATEHGLIALLVGEVPLPALKPEGNGAFKRFFRKRSIAAIMNRAGYTTLYLTTGDLSFTDKQSWLEHIGFQVIEGDQTPFYAGWPRYHFNAAADQALYAYALKQIERLQASSKRPYFMVLETVSSHLPYVDPAGRSHTEKAVFTYVDRELGHFYQKLREADFFRDGLLIIVGDHRVMAPLSKAERDRFGESAFARIPLVVATGGQKSVRIEAPFQQTDLSASLEWLVSRESRVDDWHGNFLHEPPVAATCILVPETNGSEAIYARCGASEGYIKLAGDRTRLVSGRIAPPVLSNLIDHINRSRIALSNSR